MLVQDAMTAHPVTISGGAHVKQAASLLAQHRISCLPVVDDDGYLRGVVTEADLIRDAFPPDARSRLRPSTSHISAPAQIVSGVMSAEPVTVHQTTDIAEVVEVMTARRLKSLPVVDEEGLVVGMVSRSDLVRVRARADNLIRHEVELLLASLGHRDWLVEVRDGLVDVDGPETALDRSIAAVAAQTVSGVIDVAVR